MYMYGCMNNVYINTYVCIITYVININIKAIYKYIHVNM